MRNKSKMWRAIGKRKGALALEAQADGVRRVTPRQEKHFMRTIMNSLPSNLLHKLFARAGIVSKQHTVLA